jgi:hypothetical protein
MSARSFRSVFMVASCAGAALGCYLVSLRVASERAALEKVETEIVLAQRDIRLLQTEIGTRGRLAQLERWNVKVLALSAPSADQFLDGGFALAKMVTPRDKVDLEAPVVLAAAPATRPKPQLEAAAEPEEGVSARQMMYVASVKRDPRPAVATPPKAAPPVTTASKPAAKPATAAKTPPVAGTKAPAVAKAKPAIAAKTPPAAKAKPAIAPKMPRVARAKPAASDRKAAAVDPLAPIAADAKPKKVASAAPQGPRKENGSKQ